ncbi:zf-TFIIB domain-containing protein [Rubinisphaera margarita]|uniref:zf-TFIIB domain-containing protein n=1 Tax=Rubinisphaera margarita TaxID=2909586 RepID=UPI001EE880C1|nr:zf-TFIIB domain-containing protein [Rubinisphaera margarita]MCG6157691.1 zf-TFIIB domain-containing protein [Rubinisphaera margarita]
MNCINCGAPLHFDVRKTGGLCPHCNTRNSLRSDFPAEGLEVLDLPTESLCSRCEHPMDAALLNGRPAQYCGQCHGILIADEDFAGVVWERRASYGGSDAIPAPIDPRELSERAFCPDCSAPMDCHPYYGPGNAVIDACTRCGWIWLDNGELEAIESAPGRRGR